VVDPNILEFFRINRLNLQWVDLIGSLEIFANGWIEFICNKGKDKIKQAFSSRILHIAAWEEWSNPNSGLKIFSILHNGK